MIPAWVGTLAMRPMKDDVPHYAAYLSRNIVNATCCVRRIGAVRGRHVDRELHIELVPHVARIARIARCADDLTGKPQLLRVEDALGRKFVLSIVRCSSVPEAF